MLTSDPANVIPAANPHTNAALDDPNPLAGGILFVLVNFNALTSNSLLSFD